MSDKVDKTAGHEPVLKIGGARQTQRQHRRKSGEPAVEDQEPVEPLGMFASGTVSVTSGQVAGDTVQRAFPQKAVQQMHDKPAPTIQQSHASTAHHIQQPRK